MLQTQHDTQEYGKVILQVQLQSHLDKVQKTVHTIQRTPVDETDISISILSAIEIHTLPTTKEAMMFLLQKQCLQYWLTQKEIHNK